MTGGGWEGGAGTRAGHRLEHRRLRPHAHSQVVNVDEVDVAGGRRDATIRGVADAHCVREVFHEMGPELIGAHMGVCMSGTNNGVGGGGVPMGGGVCQAYEATDAETARHARRQDHPQALHDVHLCGGLSSGARTSVAGMGGGGVGCGHAPNPPFARRAWHHHLVAGAPRAPGRWAGARMTRTPGPRPRSPCLHPGLGRPHRRQRSRQRVELPRRLPPPRDPRLRRGRCAPCCGGQSASGSAMTPPGSWGGPGGRWLQRPRQRPDPPAHDGERGGLWSGGPVRGMTNRHHKKAGVRRRYMLARTQTHTSNTDTARTHTVCNQNPDKHKHGENESHPPPLAARAAASSPGVAPLPESGGAGWAWVFKSSGARGLAGLPAATATSAASVRTTRGGQVGRGGRSHLHLQLKPYAGRLTNKRDCPAQGVPSQGHCPHKLVRNSYTMLTELVAGRGGGRAFWKARRRAGGGCSNGRVGVCARFANQSLTLALGWPRTTDALTDGDIRQTGSWLQLHLLVHRVGHAVRPQADVFSHKPGQRVVLHDATKNYSLQRPHGLHAGAFGGPRCPP